MLRILEKLTSKRCPDIGYAACDFSDFVSHVKEILD
jgi:hypothetical protein